MKMFVLTGPYTTVYQSRNLQNREGERSTHLHEQVTGISKTNLSACLKVKVGLEQG